MKLRKSLALIGALTVLLSCTKKGKAKNVDSSVDPCTAGLVESKEPCPPATPSLTETPSPSSPCGGAIPSQTLLDEQDLPASCPELPAMTAPTDSFPVAGVTVMEIRSPTCELLCLGLMISADKALAPSTCFQSGSSKRFARVDKKHYALAKAAECLPHKFLYDRKKQANTLLGGLPLAFVTTKQQIPNIKSPIDSSKTEEDNLKHSNGEPIFEPIDSLDELYWTGTEVLGRKVLAPRDFPTDGTQLIVASTPVLENCNYARSLGLFVREVDTRYLLGLPLYPINNQSDCKLWQGGIYFQVDHPLSREALSLKLQK